MTKHTALGTEEEFFTKLREGSRTKQKIVSEYFVYYNRVMVCSNPKVGYADLFAGPGFYETNAGITHHSIPLLVCEAAIREQIIRDRVHLWFNEGHSVNYQKLESAIRALKGVETLRYEPAVTNRVVNGRWAGQLAKLPVPTLVFLDPCGYKGLSLKLVASVLSGFGNDCIFFFNYSRINMKLDLRIMNNSIDEFFEPERAKALRSAVQDKSPDEREDLILAAVRSAIEQAHGIPLVFRFKSDMNRTSHHLVYASKNPRAVATMKRILNAASSTITQGVGSGEHDPRAGDVAGSLFGGLYEVEERLLSTYAGRRLRFETLLLEESQTRFTESNYRDALLNLEREGRIAVEPRQTRDGFRPELRSGRFRQTYSSISRRGTNMASKSGIEWTGATWNPSTGCDALSPGCDNCYAERLTRRLRAMGQKKYSNGFQLTLHADTIELPLKWKQPQVIFVNSMSDLFHHDVPLAFIQRVFATMRAASWHQFQILTKRSGRLQAFSEQIDWPANVWMGVSVESEAYMMRIDHLRKTGARTKFLSLEPLLGPLEELNLDGIDWVIVGGESGPGARPMNPDWVRSIRDQCATSGVAFFFKQWGGVQKGRTGRLLEGRTYDAMPRSSPPPDLVRLAAR